MTKTENESLAKAIAYLGAVEVVPGRYAFAIGGSYQTCALQPSDDGEYRVVANVKMPTKATHGWDWSPEQRFAWRYITGSKLRFSSREEAEESRYLHQTAAGRVERITADLTTGEEVSA